MKRQRATPGALAESLPTALHPDPPLECAFAALKEFESILQITDLRELTNAKILAWLKEVPSWIEWVLSVAELSKKYAASAAASPSCRQHTPLTHGSVSRLGTPLSSTKCIFPSAPLSTPHRPRAADPMDCLMGLGTVLQTLPWRRVFSSPPDGIAAEIGGAFETACVALLRKSGNLGGGITTPVVVAAMAPYSADDEALSARWLTRYDASNEGVSDDRLVEPSFAHVDVNRTARIINSVAQYHHDKVADVLRVIVAGYGPLPRWPFLSQTKRYVELLLRLAALPKAPAGCAEPILARGAVVSPIVSPVAHPAGSGGRDASPEASVAALENYVIAGHAPLLLDILMSRLVAMDAALTSQSGDVPHVRRLRLLVAHTAKRLSHAYHVRQDAVSSSAEDWMLSSLHAFHQEHVMRMTSMRAVHMLLPLVVANVDPGTLENFFHSTLSFVDKAPAYDVPLKITLTAHISPLLELLGSKLEDTVLCSLIRRLIKIAAKAASKPVAGNDRFAEGVMAAVETLAQRYGHFPIAGPGDLHEAQARQLAERAKAPGSLADIRRSVRELYDLSVDGPNEADYGEGVMSGLKGLKLARRVVAF